MEIVLFIISVIPVFLLGLYVYKKDKNKELSRVLLKLFLGGICSCFLVLITTLILEQFFPILTIPVDKANLIELLIQTFFGVAIIEEGFKWIMTYTISFKNNEFDELYDMIVYAVFVSLGFAFFENLLYVTTGGILVGLVRAISAVPGHACFGILMGYYLGLAKLCTINNQPHLKQKYIVLSILIPTIMHGIYDYCLQTQNIIFIIIFIIFVIYIFILAIKKVKQFSSINKKMIYKDKYCPVCGHIVESDYCPVCGRKNE